MNADERGYGGRERRSPLALRLDWDFGGPPDRVGYRAERRPPSRCCGTGKWPELPEGLIAEQQCLSAPMNTRTDGTRRTIWKPRRRPAWTCVLGPVAWGLALGVVCLLLWLIFSPYRAALERHAVWAWTAQGTTVHRVRADCLSAEQMAREYGWEGDWREFEWVTEQLNGWRGWPTLQLGDEIAVPDGRARQRNPQMNADGHRLERPSADPEN